MTTPTNPKIKSQSSKTERLEARVTKELKELFQRAADIQGVTLTDFLIGSLQSAAKQVIQEHEMIILSKRDQEAFVEALLNPPAASAKLRTAAQLYKQKIGV